MTGIGSAATPLLTIDTEEYLHPPFSLLARLIGDRGRFALPEDLAGMSGYLFRTAWYAGEGEARRWSQLSASFYDGDPIRLAAEACGFSLIRKEGAAGERIFLEGDEAPFTVTSRIERLEESLRVGAAAGRGERRARGGPFATGVAAYDGILADLSFPLSRTLPSSEEEAVRLAPSLTRMAVLDRSLLPALSLLVSLRATLDSLARARALLVSYLDRAGNFIDSLPPLPAYRSEAKALRRAAALLPDPWPRTGSGEDAAAEWAGRLSAGKEERAALVSLLREARDASLRAVDLLERCAPPQPT